MRRRKKFYLFELARCLDMILLRFHHDSKQAVISDEPYGLDMYIHEWITENIEFKETDG